MTEIEFLIARLSRLENLAIFLDAQGRYSSESKEQFEMVRREIATIHERLKMLRQRL